MHIGNGQLEVREVTFMDGRLLQRLLDRRELSPAELRVLLAVAGGEVSLARLAETAFGITTRGLAALKPLVTAAATRTGAAS